MVSISHWGMFDARDIPFRHWPLLWANCVDTEFDAPLVPLRSRGFDADAPMTLQQFDDRYLSGI